MLKPRPLPRHEACDCPRAVHRHGERVTYVVHACRCAPCREDNRVQAQRRRRSHLYGRHWLVDADPVRAHLRSLSAQGMGWKPAARAAGVAISTVDAILHGKLLDQPDHPEHRPPRKQVSRAVADRLLAIQPTIQDGALVDGTGTRRRLQALVTRGWSLSELARRLGKTPSNFPRTLTSESVLEGTRKAVTALYEQLWNAEPPARTRWERAAATRARKHAKRHGWVPPMAWDDDTIDNPDATPDTDNSGRGWGLDPADIAHFIDYANTREELARLCGVSTAYVMELARRYEIPLPARLGVASEDMRDQARSQQRRTAA